YHLRSIPSIVFSLARPSFTYDVPLPILSSPLNRFPCLKAKAINRIKASTVNHTSLISNVSTVSSSILDSSPMLGLTCTQHRCLTLGGLREAASGRELTWLDDVVDTILTRSAAAGPQPHINVENLDSNSSFCPILIHIDPSTTNMNSVPSPRRIREHLSRFEERYALPAKQFLQQSFDEYPFATTVMVIFAATSFTPVVLSVALAAFVVFVAASTSLVALVGLALGLSACLLTTLFSSAMLTLLVAGALRLRTSRTWFSDFRTSTTVETEDAGINATPHRRGPRFRRARPFTTARDAFRGFFSPFKRGGYKTRLLALILVADLVSRIRLPRVVRYSPIYRTLLGASLFGPRHHAHFLPYILSRPLAILRAVVWVVPGFCVRLHFKMSRWSPLGPIILYSLVFLLSPRLRKAALRIISRAAMGLFAAACVGADIVAHSDVVASAVARGKELVQSTFPLVIAFLRAVLENLEKELKTEAETEAESAPVPSAPAQGEDATSEYDMVSPLDAGGAGGSTAVAGEVAGTLRSRHVSVSDEKAE
ncbi:hypothetical protein DFH07DRAFT_335359, partial [Mycena maculata]